MTQYSLVIASWPWGRSRFGRDLNRKRVLTKVPRNRKIPVYIISDLFKRNVSKGKQNARDKKRTIKYIQEIHREVADVYDHGNCICSTFTIVILLRKRQSERDLQVTSLHLNRHETKAMILFVPKKIQLSPWRHLP